MSGRRVKMWDGMAWHGMALLLSFFPIHTLRLMNGMEIMATKEEREKERKKEKRRER